MKTTRRGFLGTMGAAIGGLALGAKAAKAAPKLPEAVAQTTAVNFHSTATIGFLTVKEIDYFSRSLARSISVGRSR